MDFSKLSSLCPYGSIAMGLSVDVKSDKNTNYSTGYVLTGCLGEAFNVKFLIKAIDLGPLFCENRE